MGVRRDVWAMTDASEPPNSWDADAYEDRHAYVYEYGEDVVDLLAPDAGERILDLGCGTGRLTDRIAATGARAVGVDSSPAMLAEARASRPRPEFVRADATALPFEAAFDAVFSNAALHWIPAADQPDALASVRRALVPGGRFVAELGGAGNVRAIREAVRTAVAARGYEPADPWYFPSIGEYARRLEANGFEVRRARLFDRPTELADGEDGLAAWLDAFGEGLLADVPAAERDAVVADAADALREERFRDGTWIADYRRLRFVAVAVEAA
jgi:SAM-dependent methyltransferase